MKIIETLSGLFVLAIKNNNIVFKKNELEIELDKKQFNKLLLELRRIYNTMYNKRDNELVRVNNKALEIASLLYKYIKKNNPNSRANKESIVSWANDIDKMLRIDKRNEIEVMQIIKFSQEDSFWKTNILSGAKLRKHYDKMWVQAKEKITNKFNYKPPPL